MRFQHLWQVLGSNEQPRGKPLIITHILFVSSHDEKHVGNVGQMLEATP